MTAEAIEQWDLSIELYLSKHYTYELQLGKHLAPT